MIKIIIFLLIGINTISSARFLPKSLLNGRIVGGVQVNISEIPYQVSMQFNDRHKCGGSLIAKNIVLTAAHCTNARNASSLSVRLGSSQRNNEGLVVQVIEIHQHPSFKYLRYRSSVDYDFSILILANYSSSNLTIDVVKLPQQNESVDDGTLVRASGWGATLNPQESKLYLRAVKVPIVNQDICKKAYESVNSIVTPNTICAGVGGKDSCSGDSGGPLTLNNTLVGVASWGNECGVDGYPSVYARVSAIRDWIKTEFGV